MRVSVVSRIASLIPAVQRELGRYPALSGVELVALAPEDCVATNEAWAKESSVVLADPGCVAGGPLEACGSLVWMQSTWAGVNALAGGRRDFRCTKLSGCFGPLIAEHVFAHVLRRERRVDELRAAQAATTWAHADFAATARPLRSLTLGVLGAGDIGQHVAGVAKAFGMRTVAYARDGEPRHNFDAALPDVEAVLGESDVLVSALPSTPETRGLLDDKLKRCAAKRPLFVNVGRGDVVSEDAVCEALDRGHLAEAVLDVFATEPLPADSRLWSHPAVRVTPHVAALSLPSDVAAVFCANLDRFLRDDDLLYPVDWGKGY